MSSILRMKGERAAMIALCMMILSPATSNAKSNHGASSRLNRKQLCSGSVLLRSTKFLVQRKAAQLAAFSAEMKHGLA